MLAHKYCQLCKQIERRDVYTIMYPISVNVGYFINFKETIYKLYTIVCVYMQEIEYYHQQHINDIRTYMYNGNLAYLKCIW